MGDSDLVRTHISIRDDQHEEVQDRNLNLSGFVRDALDEWSDRE